MVSPQLFIPTSPGSGSFQQDLQQPADAQLRQRALLGVDQALGQALRSGDGQQLQQVLEQLRQLGQSKLADLLLLLALQDDETKEKLKSALGVGSPGEEQLGGLIGKLSPDELLALAQLWDQKQSTGGSCEGSTAGPCPTGRPFGDWANNDPQLRQQISGRMRGAEQQAPKIDTSQVQMPGGSMGRLLQAVSGQESGGKYGAVNPHSGALGKYQVMPANVASWSREALGRSITPQEFLRSPDLQEKVVAHKMEQYYKQGLARTGTEEGAVRWAASAWYSGRGEKWNDTRPQSYNGHSYPSIAQYTASVYQRYLRAS